MDAESNFNDDSLHTPEEERGQKSLIIAQMIEIGGVIVFLSFFSKD